MGTLYVVGTPIGNLEDLSPRAVRVLRAATLIAAEDTRRSRKLLAHFGLDTPLTSYYEHNKLTKLATILKSLEQGPVALISDGGMPGISDPGYELINAAVAAGHVVSPVPGPSAVSAALVVSGLPTDAYVFLGFLPRRSAARRAVLEENAAERRTLVAFESPHRLAEALDDVAAVLGDRPLAVARELTKMYEEVFRGTAYAARDHFASEAPRGEVTLVIGGAPKSEVQVWPEARVRVKLNEMLEAGVSPTTAAKSVARDSGWARRDVYRLAVADDSRGS